MKKIERHNIDLNSQMVITIGKVLNIFNTTDLRKIVVTHIEIFVDDDDTITTFYYRLVNSMGKTIYKGEECFSESDVNPKIYKAYKLDVIVDLIFALIDITKDSTSFYIDASWAISVLTSMKSAIDECLSQMP